jgi:hypothetical protein
MLELLAVKVSIASLEIVVVAAASLLVSAPPMSLVMMMMTLVRVIVRLEAVDRAVLVGLLVGVEFVADLAAGLAAAELAALLEARVPVDADLPAVHNLNVKAVDSLLSLLARGVLDKAEAAGGLLALVEAHDQVHDLATQPEELQQLRLVCIEGQVAHVKRR